MIKSRNGARGIFTEALKVRVHHKDEVDLKKASKTFELATQTRADRSGATLFPGRFSGSTSKVRKKRPGNEVGLSLGLLERELITLDVNKHN